MRGVRNGSVLLWGFLTIVACGQVEPVLMHVTMPDCTYQGVAEMEEGEVSLSLSLNGLADAGAVLVELTSGHTFEDLETHLDSVSNELDDLPDWVVELISLRLADTEGRDGIEGSERLRAGSYAVLCIDYPYDDGAHTVSVAGPLEVSP